MLSDSDTYLVVIIIFNWFLPIQGHSGWKYGQKWAKNSQKDPQIIKYGVKASHEARNPKHSAKRGV